MNPQISGKATYRSFEQLGRPIRYLTDSSLSKEDLARRRAQRYTYFAFVRVHSRLEKICVICGS